MKEGDLTGDVRVWQHGGHARRGVRRDEERNLSAERMSKAIERQSPGHNEGG